MKFLVFATTALASAPLAQRDINTIIADVTAISTKVTALQSIVNGFTGAADAAKLIAASEDVVASIKKGTADAVASDNLEDVDAAQLIGPIQDLTKVIQDTINTLNGKKSVAVGTGRGCEVEPQLVEQKKDTQAFSDAIVSKVSDTLKAIAAGLSQPILDALQSGIDTYKGVECSGTTTSSPGGTTTSSPGTTTSKPGSATTTAPGTTSKSGSATGTGPWSTGHHGNGTATETDLTTVTTSVCPTTSAGTTLVTVPTSATGGAGNPPPTGGNGGSPTQSNGGGSPTQSTGGSGSTQPPVIPVGAGVALRGELPFAMAIALIAAAIL